MIERPGMRPPPGVFRPPPQQAPPGADPPPSSKGDKEDASEAKEEKKEEKEKKKPVVPSGPPKPETPWERGLRQAKEVGLLPRAELSKFRHQASHREFLEAPPTLYVILNEDPHQHLSYEHLLF